MRKLIRRITCLVLGHRSVSHLDYIYGSLPREHAVCQRCQLTTKFERPTAEREAELPLVDCF